MNELDANAVKQKYIRFSHVIVCLCRVHLYD